VKRLGILLSGRGSNFEAIADQVAAGRIHAEIAVVISNRSEARGLEAATARGLNAVCVPSKGLDREPYDLMLVDELKRNGVDLICLAGFMRLLSVSFIRAFPHRVLNIHPSLLPAFPAIVPFAYPVSGRQPLARGCPRVAWLAVDRPGSQARTSADSGSRRKRRKWRRGFPGT